MAQRSLPLPAPIADDELVRIARRFRKESIATLITICRDVNAPASARAAASAKLLEYSDGRPGQARPITVEDISDLDDDQCERLYRALMNRIETRRPGFFKAMMRDIVDQMLALQATQPSLPVPKKFGFRRGKLAGAGPAVPRWPTTPPASIGHGALQAELGPEAPLHTAPSDLRSNSLVNRVTGNVVVMPGVERRPAPFGIKYGLDTDLPQSPSNGSGRISPDVVARSAFKDPLALDAAFNGFNSRRKRPW
jgi:hypothetical protein